MPFSPRVALLFCHKVLNMVHQFQILIGSRTSIDDPHSKPHPGKAGQVLFQALVGKQTEDDNTHMEAAYFLIPLSLPINPPDRHLHNMFAPKEIANSPEEVRRCQFHLLDSAISHKDIPEEIL